MKMIIQVLCIPDDFMMQKMVFWTQQHLSSYARQGLRVLVMAKRTLSDMEYNDWLQKHDEATLVLENRERRIRERYWRLETNLILLGEFVWQVSYLFYDLIVWLQFIFLLKASFFFTSSLSVDNWNFIF